MNNKKKCTLLVKLLQEGWFENENEIIPWIIKRAVLFNDQQAHSLKQLIPCDSIIRIKEYYKKKYVNKGGLKLEKALIDFNISVNNKILLDCGASTGGFTDCLMQKGAKIVYAVDGGCGQLSSKLLNNARVINMEKTNLMDHTLTQLSPKPDIITLDLNNISLRESVVICKEILKDEGIIIALIKPIYEVESKEIRRTGLINDREIIKDILHNLCDYFIEKDLYILGLTYSPIRGNGGTLEYFICLGFNTNNFVSINSEYDNYINECTTKSFLIEKFDKNTYIPD